MIGKILAAVLALGVPGGMPTEELGPSISFLRVPDAVMDLNVRKTLMGHPLIVKHPVHTDVRVGLSVNHSANRVWVHAWNVRTGDFGGKHIGSRRQVYEQVALLSLEHGWAFQSISGAPLTTKADWGDFLGRVSAASAHVPPYDPVEIERVLKQQR